MIETREHMILDATLEILRCPLDELRPWLNYLKALEGMKRAAHLNADTFRFYVDQFEAAARDLPKK